MQTSTKFYVLLALLLISGVCRAVHVENLYLVTWPVKEQSNSALWRATLAGFKEVLVRKSGSKGILESEEVHLAFKKVTSYLQRFEYASQTVINSEYPYSVSLYFEPRLIDDIISEAQMPLWGSNRPLTILWLAVEDNFERHVIKENDSEEDFTTLIHENSVRRGVPTITPLMDLEDELLVSVSDIWGRFPSTINQASERYSSDSIIIGRINNVGQMWHGKFTYLNQNTEFAFEVTSEEAARLVADMMDRLADLLCNKYCVVEESGSKNEILMSVSEVNNFNEFKAAENYIESLSSIEKTEIVNIVQRSVVFKLTLRGQIESLIEGINLSQKMRKIEIDDSQSANLQQATTVDNIEDLTDVIPKNLIKDSNSEEANLGEEPNDIKSTNESNKLITLYYRWIG